MNTQNAICRRLMDEFAFGFEGRVNILNSLNSQYLGHLMLLKGKIIEAQYQGRSRMIALADFSLDLNCNPQNLSLVFEAEKVEEFGSFLCSFEDLFKLITDAARISTSLKKLRPDNTLSFTINYDFFIRSEIERSDEFNVLKRVVDDGRVESLYKNSGMSEHRLTKILIALKQKGALKVAKIKVS